GGKDPGPPEAIHRQRAIGLRRGNQQKGHSGVATTAAVGSGTGVGRFFETQSSKGGRYTVTLPNGTKVEEVNKVTAAQMVPFDNIQFTGNYGNMTEISYQTAKRAAKKGAKYYHITRQWQERGGNITISADLYK
ncbi:YdgH/BhsA/McbA-like domain containing protein, partial [Klebsiella pneumoniae]|uniref:YdgH/BhsA/McbA-like domain containing protein n=1 Tax=Klebsiella pneumoniae TaxID=573 RepID=UPI003A80602F